MAAPTIIKDVLGKNLTAIGILDSGEIFGLTDENRKGNLYILGKSGYGKTALLESILAADLVKSRAGLLIDPFGDIIAEALKYARKNKTVVFEAVPGDAESNIKKFKKQIDFRSRVWCRIWFKINF